MHHAGLDVSDQAGEMISRWRATDRALHRQRESV